MLSEWLPVATRRLEQAGITTARLDCLVLLEDATGKDRAWLLANPEYQLAQGPTLSKLNGWIKRRAKHEPLAYLRGKTEFYGREFTLCKKVLEPRPESEAMVDLLKKIIRKQETGIKEIAVIVDLGTGSGAIGITAALEFPGSKVVLTDIDEDCLKVARLNAKRYEVKPEFVQGDLLEPLLSTPVLLNSIILANLPYVPDHYQINEAALMEPRIAIFGGPDGLDLYRRMFEQTQDTKQKPKYILTECLPFQHDKLAKIAKTAMYELIDLDDFIQLFQLH